MRLDPVVQKRLARSQTPFSVLSPCFSRCRETCPYRILTAALKCYGAGHLVWSTINATVRNRWSLRPWCAGECRSALFRDITLDRQNRRSPTDISTLEVSHYGLFGKWLPNITTGRSRVTLMPVPDTKLLKQ